MKKLHQLINCLSQAEKRFVKIRLKSNKADSSLTSHFELLSKQKVYDLSKLLNQDNRSLKLIQSNLSLLYEVILKHLRSFPSNKNFEQNFRDDLIDVKTLVNKGLIDESKLRCYKLIKKAKLREEFDVVLNAYKELWDIHMLNGNLSLEINNEIQVELKSLGLKKQELIELEAIYRNVTTLYYQYFFTKRDSKFQEEIQLITQDINRENLKSAKAKHAFFEIKAVEYVIIGDIDKHHELRKEQLFHLFSLEVFKDDYLHRLLVLSNLFIKLKSKGFIIQLSRYLDIMGNIFPPSLLIKRDSVFMEKYYDIFFLNQCFLQTWNPDQNKIDELVTLFNNIISKKYISNQFLIGRIYLSLVELYILTDQYKSAIPLLVDFFNLSKKNKHSKHYIEGDIHFLVVNYLMKKNETLENSLVAVNRKIKSYNIELDPDQSTLLSLLNDISKNDVKDLNFYFNSLKNKQSYKIYIYKLTKNIPTDKIRKEYFPINDLEYDENQDNFLKSLKKFY